MAVYYGAYGVTGAVIKLCMYTWCKIAANDCLFLTSTCNVADFCILMETYRIAGYF